MGVRDGGDFEARTGAGKKLASGCEWTLHQYNTRIRRGTWAQRVQSFDEAAPFVSISRALSTTPPKPTGRVRFRDLGFQVGRFPTGRLNAITDVRGVAVGHSTIVRGSGRLVPGKGPVRTGVTAVLPSSANIFDERVIAGAFVLNGAGEVAGLTQAVEWGLIETPILLTNTMSVGQVSDAAVKYMINKYPGIGEFYDVIIPVVGECDDSYLNDAKGRHVTDTHVFEAINTATVGGVAEGAVGAGTGMNAYDFKSGIGTSSRVLPGNLGGFTVGVLVLSNLGVRRNLTVIGVPVGEELIEYHLPKRHVEGSIIVVVATNAPLLSNQLTRLAKRAALGIGRTGSFASHTSGEIIVAFSTANKVPRGSRKLTTTVDVLLDHRMDPIYEAVIEATEEAILNSLCMAQTMDGINGVRSHALPLDRVVDILRRYNRPTRAGAVAPPPTPPEEVATAKKRPDVLPGTLPHPRGTPITKEGVLKPEPVVKQPVTEKFSKAEIEAKLKEHERAKEKEKEKEKDKDKPKEPGKP